jgi:uncharacterized protein YbcI
VRALDPEEGNGENMSDNGKSIQAEIPIVAQISRDIVHVHARFYGRGPTRAKTIWRDEIVVCVLEDIFTKAELLLIDAGRFSDVRLNRQAFQDEVEPLLRAMVESATGRRVKSFLSQVAIDGAASEVFRLDGPNPSGRISSG